VAQAARISDKYIQQDEPDQEAAFQKAFTLELLVSTAFFVVLIFALPVYGVVYGHAAIIIPGIVAAASVPLSAFEAPSWIPYRRMQFVRERTLSSVDPVVSLVVTVGLGVAGLGTGAWSSAPSPAPQPAASRPAWPPPTASACASTAPPSASTRASRGRCSGSP